MEKKEKDRRRFIKIAGSLAFAGAGISRANDTVLKRFAKSDFVLGADTQIQLYHSDRRIAESTLDDCYKEIRRLEAIFSLYQENSAICQLNKNGFIRRAPKELTEVVRFSLELGRLTSGAFDITVQPLWKLYNSYFRDYPESTIGPAQNDINDVLHLIDYLNVIQQGQEIYFKRKEMAITLNGIAQGYITDKVTSLLEEKGISNVLVNMGEYRALGAHSSNKPWKIGIARPEKPWEVSQTIDLNNNEAVSTSGGYGSPFDSSGRHHHIFNPRTGRSCNLWKSVSVVARSAITADALSTSLSVLSEKEGKILSSNYDVRRVIYA